MFVLFALVSLSLHAADRPPVNPTVQRSQWNGFERLDLFVAGRPCLLVRPKVPAAGNPWIWRTEFFGHEPQADIALLERGWHLAYMDAKDMYGSPQAMSLFGQFYAFNFAAAHPNRVAALYLDAPVLDIRSWPGRNRAAKEWKECLAAYNLTEETLVAFRGNPLDRIPLVASGRVPIIAVCVDADTTVPFAENTALLEKRYRELGGTIEVILKPGGEHHPHSLKDPTPIVNFLLQHARL